MKNILFTAFLSLIILSCGSDDGSDGPQIDTPRFLEVGDTEQEGVSYFDFNGSISFSETNQVGDSTYYEASLDLNQDTNADIDFTIVRWDNSQVLLITGTNATIPFSGSEFEIFGTTARVDGVTILPTGTAIDEAVQGYASNEQAFITNTESGSVVTSVILTAWSSEFFLPFKLGGSEGWVGLSIVAPSSGGAISAIGVGTIAIR